MPYSVVGDLLHGNVPLPAYINPESFINSAAEEIDAVVGQIYVTPVSVQVGPTTRPTMLVLKKANNFLATGRIILAMDSAGQDDALHKYGRYLVGEAEKILQAITEGKILLTGATPINGTTNSTVPTIKNAEGQSLVDQFYENFNVTTWPHPSKPAYLGRPEGDV